MEEEGVPINQAPITVIQEQVHDILFSREIGWQEVIYDLINTEQLDPWDLDLSVLTNKYLEKIQRLEETDFFVSSKVLLAASLLLRIKSEILLNKYIRSIDDILFGKKDEIKRELERLELDDEIPELIPRSPMPRFKKVTLKELIESLNKAITTENRRIKKEILNKNALREAAISLPKKTINIKDQLKNVYAGIVVHLDPSNENSRKKVSFTELIGTKKEERIASFYPLLHLESQQKIWLDQEDHFEEIYIWLKKTYLRHNPDPFKDIKEELEMEANSQDSAKMKRVKEINKDFENPLADMFDKVL